MSWEMDCNHHDETYGEYEKVCVELESLKQENEKLRSAQDKRIELDTINYKQYLVLKQENEKLIGIIDDLKIEKEQFKIYGSDYYSENKILKQENEKLRELVREAFPRVERYWDELVEIHHREWDKCDDWIENAQAILNKDKV